MNRFALDFRLPAMIAAQFHRGGIEHYQQELAPGIAQNVDSSDVAWLIEHDYVAGKVRKNAAGKVTVIALAGIRGLHSKPAVANPRLRPHDRGLNGGFHPPEDGESVAPGR